MSLRETEDDLQHVPGTLETSQNANANVHRGQHPNSRKALEANRELARQRALEQRQQLRQQAKQSSRPSASPAIEQTTPPLEPPALVRTKGRSIPPTAPPPITKRASRAPQIRAPLVDESESDGSEGTDDVSADVDSGISADQIAQFMEMLQKQTVPSRPPAPTRARQSQRKPIEPDSESSSSEMDSEEEAEALRYLVRSANRKRRYGRQPPSSMADVSRNSVFPLPAGNVPSGHMRMDRSGVPVSHNHQSSVLPPSSYPSMLRPNSGVNTGYQGFVDPNHPLFPIYKAQEAANAWKQTLASLPSAL